MLNEIPILYLKGVSTGDFEEALAAAVLRQGRAWSVRRRRHRAAEGGVDRGAQAHWLKRRPCAAERLRLSLGRRHPSGGAARRNSAQCILSVIIGATADGRKQLLVVHDGFREAELSWIEVLESLKRRGLEIAPKLAVGDGALGFWAALPKVFPATREQRCWVHKTANVLNKLPKSQHTKAKRALQAIWMAETRAEAETAFDAFVETYAVKYEKAADCLKKDREALLAFYDFPASIGST